MLLALPEILLFAGLGVKLSGKLLIGPLPQRLFQELARFPAFVAHKSFGGDGRFALECDNDLDRFTQLAPPTLMESFTDPSASCCSVQVWPRFLDSIFVFSIAYP